MVGCDGIFTRGGWFCGQRAFPLPVGVVENSGALEVLGITYNHQQNSCSKADSGYYRAPPKEEKEAGGGAASRRRFFGEHGQQLSGLELVGRLLKGLFLGYGGGHQSIIVLPSKPPSKSLFEAVLYQWLEGIPLDAPTHRDLTAAMQRALSTRPPPELEEKKEETDAAKITGRKRQTWQREARSALARRGALFSIFVACFNLILNPAPCRRIRTSTNNSAASYI